MAINFLHFKPNDGWVGDPMPLYHNGIYHVYYNKQYEDPQLRGWGHISSPDMINWDEHPDPFDKDTPGKPYNTGCVIYAEGKYHAFYAGIPDPERPQYMPILHSTSDDGIKFIWNGKIALDLPHDDKYYRMKVHNQDHAWRDPDVFYSDEDECYYMVFCAQRPHIPGNVNYFTGACGLARSRDLDNWELLPPICDIGTSRTMECPNIFKINEKQWGLIYFWHQTRIRVSDSMYGPWRRTDVYSPDSFDFHAAKSLWDGKRRICFSMIKRTECDCSKRTMTGQLSFPHELYFKADGTPLSRFPDEIRNIFPVRLEHTLTERIGKWNINECAAEADGTDFVALAMSKHNIKTYYLSFDTVIPEKTATFITMLHCDEQVNNGYQLIFDASENRISLREHYEWDQRDDITSVPFSVTPGTPFHVDIIADKDILEVCINDERTLVSRMRERNSGSFGFFVQDGGVKISNIMLKQGVSNG